MKLMRGVAPCWSVSERRASRGLDDGGLGSGRIAQGMASLLQEDVVQAGSTHCNRLQLETGPVEQAEHRWHRCIATVDVQSDALGFGRRLSNVGLRPKQLECAVAIAVEPECDDVAGDFAFKLLGRTFGDDPAVVNDRESIA